MPVHPNQAAMASGTPKRGLRGAAGGTLSLNAGLALNTAGGARYDAAILGDVYKAAHLSATGIDEVVTLTSNAAAWTAGTFTVTFGAQTTALIPFNATFKTVLEAIAALSTIKGGVQLVPTALAQGTDSAVVDPSGAITGGDARDNFAIAGGARVLKFKFVGKVGAEDVGAVTTDVTLITGGTPGLTAAVAQAGAA